MALFAAFLLAGSATYAQQQGAADGTREINIEAPRSGESVGTEVKVKITAPQLGAGAYIWTLARRTDFAPLWWPQEPARHDAAQRQWEGIAMLGQKRDKDYDFNIGVVIVDAAGHAFLSGYRQNAIKTGDFKPIELPPGASLPVVVTVKKTRD